MSTCKALVLESFDKPITIRSLPTPTVVLGSVLVSPIYAGIQSYLRAIFTGALPYPLTLPQTPGPSAIARVEAVGPDATNVKPGDIVWVDPTISARDNPDAQILLGLNAGITPGSRKLMAEGWRNGCFAEKALVPLENVFVLPTRLFESKNFGGMGYRFQELATLAFVLVPYGGLESAGVGAGTTVIVAPATGKFSGGAVLAALAMGAKVVAAGRNEEALKRLYNFPGAEDRLSTVRLEQDVEKDTQSLMAATGGAGAHVFIDLSPGAVSGPSTATHITAGITCLRRNGEAILMGGVTSDISLPYRLIMFKNITVRGRFMYEHEQIKRFIRMIENGNLVLGKRVGLTAKAVFRLEDVERALVEAEGATGWGGDVLFAPNGVE